MGGVLSYVVFLKAQILEREKVLYFSDPVVKACDFSKCRSCNVNPVC